jgi:predicted O-methyltransferase YrrM
MGTGPHFVTDHHLQLGGHDFYCAFPLTDPPEGHQQVEKPRDLVERYIAMIEEVRPTRIVELGIRRGGSTVLLSELARPEKLVTVDIEPALPPGLSRYLEQSGKGETVRAYCGVDQSDRARLGAIVAEEFEGKPLDLVIDDASHYYEQTLASFEVLFPQIRPVGLFIIEDWPWEHRLSDHLAAALRDSSAERRAEMTAVFEEAMTGGPRRPPLTRLVIELLLARASSGDAVQEISVGPYWVAVRRGPGALDPVTFRVADLFHDHYDLL